MSQRPSGRVSASAYCSCWFDLQWWRSRSKQLFSAPYVTCRCVPEFLVMVISNLIYQFLYVCIYLYRLEPILYYGSVLPLQESKVFILRIGFNLKFWKFITFGCHVIFPQITFNFVFTLSLLDFRISKLIIKLINCQIY